MESEVVHDQWKLSVSQRLVKICDLSRALQLWTGPFVTIYIYILYIYMYIYIVIVKISMEHSEHTFHVNFPVDTFAWRSLQLQSQTIWEENSCASIIRTSLGEAAKTHHSKRTCMFPEWLQ